MIRIAKMEDVQRINEMGNKLHNNFDKLFHIETEINNENSIVLVDEIENKVYAYLYAQLLVDNIDILSIYVDEHKRRSSIGTNLIKYLYNNYCYHVKSITLEVDVDNLAAIKLYEKSGFNVIYKRNNYYGNKDAFLMKKEW